MVDTTVEHGARLEAHGRVSFEIDRIDESMGEGWSVLVTGSARTASTIRTRCSPWPAWG